MRIVDACVEIGRLPMCTWDAGDAIMEPLLFCLDFVRVMCASRLLDWGAGDWPMARRRLYGSGVPEGATATATRGSMFGLWLGLSPMAISDLGFASTRLCVLVWRELHYY